MGLLYSGIMKTKNDLTAEEARNLFHYDPVTGVLIRKVTVGNTAKVGWIAGSISNTGHLTVRVNGGLYLVHRIIWLIQTGEWPKCVIDHINCIPSDNRWDNLRDAEHYQNRANGRIYKNNTSGLKGVSFDKSKNKWEAYIRSDNKKVSLGRFATPEEAHEAYKYAAILRYGEFARFS